MKVLEAEALHTTLKEYHILKKKSIVYENKYFNPTIKDYLIVADKINRRRQD